MSKPKPPKKWGKLPKPAWGSIDELPSGRIRLRGPVDGERTPVGTYATPEEACGAALEMKRRLDGTPRGMTVSQWGAKWLNAREKAGRHRGVDDTRGLWRRYIDGTRLGDRLLRELRTPHVAQWLFDLAQRSSRQGTGVLSHSTVSNTLTALSVCLRDAVIAGHATMNAAAGVVLPPKPARTEEEWTYLRSDELAALLAHPALEGRDGPRVRRILTVAIYTGMREGELWGLRWPDVHLEEGDEHVIVRYGDSAGGPTKSGRIRRVPLFPPARAALRELRDEGGTTKIGGHVFVSPRKRNGEIGHPHAEGYDAGWAGSWHRPKKVGGVVQPLDAEGLPPKVWRDGWRERCGVRSEVTFHDLRHTCASHLIMGTWGRRWRIEEIQVLLGHTSITVTQRYAHLAPEGMAATVADAERMWREPPAPVVTSQVTPIGSAKVDARKHR